MTLKTLSPLIPVVMLPLGLYLGWRAFRDHSLSEIAAALGQIPAGNLALAALFTAASYLCLTGFDALALRYVGRRLPYPRIALTSFVSLSIGHNVGVAALSSGTLRYRFYSESGLSAAEVGKIILFCGVTVGLGLTALGGIALLLRPGFAGGVLGLGAGLARLAGGGLLLLCALYVALCWRGRRPFRIPGPAVGLPGPRLAAAQLLLGTVNFACVAAVLHQLLAGALAYPETIAVYVLSSAAAFLTHVPGGLGVIEYVVASLVPQGNVVGALIGLRIVYFFLPLLLGGALLAVAEIRRWRCGMAEGGVERGEVEACPAPSPAARRA